MSRRRMTQGELLEAADTIRRLLAALRAGELTAPPHAHRPDRGLLGAAPLHDTNV